MRATVAARIRVAHRRLLYTGLSGLMAVIAIVGFWSGYLWPLLLGTQVQPLPVYLIGLAVFVIRAFSISIIAPTTAWGSFAHWVFGLAT